MQADRHTGHSVRPLMTDRLGALGIRSGQILLIITAPLSPDPRPARQAGNTV